MLTSITPSVWVNVPLGCGRQIVPGLQPGWIALRCWARSKPKAPSLTSGRTAFSDGHDYSPTAAPPTCRSTNRLYAPFGMAIKSS